MRITSAGNVGINNTNPQAKLHINSPGLGEFAGANSSIAGGSHLMLKDEGSGNRDLMSGPSVVFQTPASADGSNIWATSRLLGSPSAAGSARGTFSIQVRDQYDPFNDGTSWNWRTCLTAINTGNIGIGRNDPFYTLDIRSTNQYALRLNTPDVNGCFLNIQTNGTNIGYLGTSYHLVSGTQSVNDLTLRADNNLQFTTGGGTERMRITSAGAAIFYAQGTASYGTINLESDDPFIRLYDNGAGGTTDKKKWDIRAIGAAGSEQLDFRTVNDANTVFATKLSILHNGHIYALGLGGSGTAGSDVRYSTATGRIYYQTSSKRYKTDIVNLESSLDKINSLRPVRYKDINTGEPACGLIAEETVKVIPEVVFNKEIEGFDEPQIEGINYTDIVPFLIKSIQELKAEIELLKSK
jgi:hypothetical protein